MKKIIKYIALIIAAALVLNLAAACGSKDTSGEEAASVSFDVESISKAVESNLDDVNSYELSSVIEYDYTISTKDSDTTVKTAINGSEETVINPLGSHITQKAVTSYNGNKSSQDAEVYIVSENGSMVTYLNSSGSWTKSTLTQTQSTKFYIDIFKDVAEGNLDASLAGDTAYVNDSDCYQLKVTLNEEYIRRIVSNIYNSSDIADGIDAEGLDITLVAYIDCNDLMPVRMKMDFKEIGSMLMKQMTTEEETLAGQTASVEYVTDKFEIVYEYTGFDTINRITVPNEVKSEAD